MILVVETDTSIPFDVWKRSRDAIKEEMERAVGADRVVFLPPGLTVKQFDLFDSDAQDEE